MGIGDVPTGEPDWEWYGQLVREERRRRKWSLDDAARQPSMPGRTKLGHIERGRFPAGDGAPTAQTLAGIERTYGWIPGMSEAILYAAASPVYADAEPAVATTVEVESGERVTVIRRGRLTAEGARRVAEAAAGQVPAPRDPTRSGERPRNDTRATA